MYRACLSHARRQAHTHTHAHTHTQLPFLPQESGGENVTQDISRITYNIYIFLHELCRSSFTHLTIIYLPLMPETGCWRRRVFTCCWSVVAVVVMHGTGAGTQFTCFTGTNVQKLTRLRRAVWLLSAITLNYCVARLLGVFVCMCVCVCVRACVRACVCVCVCVCVC